MLNLFKTNKKLKVGFIDTQVCFYESLAESSSLHQNISFEFINTDPEQMCSGVEKIDILVFNIIDNRFGGLMAIEKIYRHYPSLKIIALANHEEQFNLPLLYQSGYWGYVPRNRPLSNFYKTLYKVHCYNERVFPNVFQIARNQQQKRKNAILYNGERFSKNELKVVSLMCLELDNAQIASKMCLSKRTIEGYKTKINEKLKTNHPMALVKMALQLKLVSI